MKIHGMEILSEGNWNGHEFNEDTLKQLEQQQDEIILIEAHNEDVANPTKEPVGAIQRLYRQGKKLLADVIGVPSKVAQLIADKFYKGVSCEGVDGKLTAVALLPPDKEPAVKDLAPVPLALQSNFSTSTDYIAVMNISEEKKERVIKLQDELLKEGYITPAMIDAGLTKTLELADSEIKLEDGDTALDKLVKVLKTTKMVKLEEKIEQAKPDECVVSQHYEKYKEGFSRWNITKEELVNGWKNSKKTPEAFLNIRGLN